MASLCFHISTVGIRHSDLLLLFQDPPQTQFIVCVSSLRPLNGWTHDLTKGVNEEVARHRRMEELLSKRKKEKDAEMLDQKNVYDLLVGSLTHEPQVPRRMGDLVGSKGTVDDSQQFAITGFDAHYIWKQLHDLQILVREVI